MKTTHQQAKTSRFLVGILLSLFVAIPIREAVAASSSTTVVTFDANGGTGTMKKQTFLKGVSQRLRANAFKRKGGVFVGWAKSRNGAIAYKNRQRFQPVGGRVTLYARWAKSTYKVRFMPNGGKGKMAVESFKYGKAKKLSRNRFTRKGYIFAGWSDRPNGAVKFSDGKKVKNLTKTGYTIHLYAVWKWKKVSLKRYCVIDLSAGPNASRYPVSYRDSPPTGGFNTDEFKTTKLVLRLIYPGTFTMGSPEGEKGRWGDETRHKVTLTKPFYIGLFEVTQRQWELVMGTRPSFFSNASYYAKRPVECVSYNDIRGSSKGSRWPASRAVDASSFMGRLRARAPLGDGMVWDLPTEAQWEYACRAGTTTALNSGKNLANMDSDSYMGEVGRYWYNGGSVYSSSCTTAHGTAEVGSYRPNAWGLYDMHGNVWEYCLDWYRYDLGSSAVTDPKGASSGSHRLKRGGCWYDIAEGCRSAYRVSCYPSKRNYYYGFRPAGILPE